MQQFEIGEISLEIDNLDKASINFNLGAELSKNRISFKINFLNSLTF